MSEFIYHIRRLPAGCGRLNLAGVFDPAALPAEYAALEEAQLSHFPFDENGYKPDCRARVGWNEAGLHVLMYANEPVIRAEVAEVGGPVCQDSCLEFFFAPKEGQLKYFNCEVSPRPIVHLGIGEGRHGRSVFQTLPEGIDPLASRHEGGWWAVSYTIPAAFLKEYFSATLAPGQHLRGNFYKCGDKAEQIHYGMFKPYTRLDYHIPTEFADFILQGD